MIHGSRTSASSILETAALPVVALTQHSGMYESLQRYYTTTKIYNV